MKISYNWLQDLIKQKLPQPEELADLLTMHSFETELVGKKKGDYLLEIDILPNRAHDCLGHLGVAREIATVLKYSLKTADYSKKIKEKGKAVKDFLKIEVEDKNLCPRYTARALIGVKIGDSPKWMQERLRVCGLRPINNIVDITNYAMLETGQPLHAFDFDKLGINPSDKKAPSASVSWWKRISLSGKKNIVIRRAKKGENFVSLDNDKYDLDENVLVIADKKNPLCLAGIKGGKIPEIDKGTVNIVLEAANFNPQSIRQTSQRLKLKTDASWRFEHQLDANLTKEAINMAAYLIQKIARGKILKGLIDIYPVKTKPKKVILDLDRINKLLGIDIPLKEVSAILKRLDFEFEVLKNTFQVTIPTRRLDISIAEDLIEEIGRLYGYENIPGCLPEAVLIPPERNEDLFYQNRIREILTGLGFSETYNYSFVSEAENNNVEVLNPISQEQKYLRSNLIPNLLKNIKENKKYFEEVRLFEIGRVFQKEKKEVKEQKRLAGIISLGAGSNKDQEFYYLKGVVDSLLNKLRISDQWYDDAVNELLMPDFYHPLKRAEIKAGNDLIGWLGEIESQKAAAFELDFEKLVELAVEERIYQAPSKYPAVVRDIAVLTELETKVAEVLNVIHQAGGELIQDIDLFDMYEGENIPGSRKSLAFHIIYQSNDHTLTDKEVNKLQQKIIKALEEEGGWEVRK